MNHYFVNTKLSKGGKYEVHVENCMYLPKITERNYLGLYITDNEAIKFANITYKDSVACTFCLKHADSKLFVDDI